MNWSGEIVNNPSLLLVSFGDVIIGVTVVVGEFGWITAGAVADELLREREEREGFDSFSNFLCLISVVVCFDCCCVTWFVGIKTGEIVHL